ncbi:MAG: M20/M25/M40 family metallo-hydrolase [Holophagaceae bacterium]|nr:M20/M25/M40 family metallo-hydrolase [Holophagaceae bacterium]
MSTVPNTSASSLVVELCREFVRIPSPSGGEGALAAVVAARMAGLGFAVETDRYGSVLGMRRGSRPGPTVLLDAHLDTVPVTRPEAWTQDPYGAALHAGRLWGRGAADTKGSIAAMLCAATAMTNFPGTLLVSASVGEEDLTSAALSHVLDRHPADVVLVGEPTSLCLGVAQKGRAGLVLEATGRSAHTSRPELGDNAAYKLMEAITRLRALPLPTDPELGRGVCELIEISSEPMPSRGMVPHLCTARFALRLLPGETAASVLDRTTQALSGLDGLALRIPEARQTCHTGAELIQQDCIPGWRCQHPELRARLLTALGTPAFAAPYTTNASAAAARGIPTFLLGPGAIEQAHIVDEWVALDQLTAAVTAYQTALRVCLGA